MKKIKSVSEKFCQDCGNRVILAVCEGSPNSVNGVPMVILEPQKTYRMRRERNQKGELVIKAILKKNCAREHQCGQGKA